MTRPTLLSKVRRGEEAGWNQFYELYEDFIYSAGRGAELSDDKSKDLVQEVMLSVRDYIGNFVPDKSRGRFRTWLRKIVRSRIADHYRKGRRDPLEQAQGTCATDELSTSATNRLPNLNEVDLEQLIDGKLEQAILGEARRLAKERVRMEDYQAYHMFQVHELNTREVAASLAISPVTVRVRAFRVRRVVEREMRRIVKLLDNPKLVPE